MSKNLILKGTQSGFTLEILDNADFNQVLVEFKQLMTENIPKQAAENNTLKIIVETGNRLLTQTEKQALYDLLADQKHLELTSINSNVISQIEMQQILKKQKVSVIADTLRSGQELFLENDILFLGTLHKGAILKSTGNIYCLGAVQGIIHAGFPDNQQALIIGDLKQAAQIRIAENIEIIENLDSSNQTVAYLGELNQISYGDVSQLKTINLKYYQSIKE